MTSKVEWTDDSWNPATGCTPVSTGCKHCYAEKLAKRLRVMGKPKYRNGFKYTEHWDAIDLPLRWRKPRRVFVNSMSDLFHENATDEFLHKVFWVMEKASRHTFQVLTKRLGRRADHQQPHIRPVSDGGGMIVGLMLLGWSVSVLGFVACILAILVGATPGWWWMVFGMSVVVFCGSTATAFVGGRHLV